MRKLKTKSKAKITRYIPILLILLSITIMIGSTFAYFTDKADESSSLTFSKVELSSETTVGIDGKIGDALPGTPLVDSPISFSKAIDSEAIYVRAKISFTLPNEYEYNLEMVNFLAEIKNSTNFGILTTEQNGAVWSEKQGDYFYLLDNSNTDNLFRVEDIGTYVLSECIIIPRDLEQLEDNYQYMKDIYYHIAFEAIQADNVSTVLEETKNVFNSIFPSSDLEEGSFVVRIMGEDLAVDSVEVFTDPVKLERPTIELLLDEDGTSIKVVEGWYTEDDFVNKFDFDEEVSTDISLYPRILDVSQNLYYNIVVENTSTYSLRSTQQIALSVSVGECTSNEIVIPDYYLGAPVKYIAADGFKSKTAITNVVLPSTLVSIGSNAFSGCTKLTSINLPENLETIGSYAFSGCTKLKDVKFSNGINEIGSYAFASCSSMTEINLPASLNKIDSYAFNSCTGLTNVVLPDGIETLGDNAFRGCTNLESVFIPSSLTEMVGHPFISCPNLVLSIDEDSAYKVENDCLIDTNTNSLLISFNASAIPNGITIIANYAFANCTNLTDVIIPDSVTKLGDYAFANCTNLTSIQIPNTLTNIGQYLFNSCTNLQSANIPTELTQIPDYMFNGCSSLTSITIPENVTRIGSGAFGGCSSLTSITIPENVTYISYAAFNNTYNVTEFYLNAKNLSDNGYSDILNSCGKNSSGATLYVGPLVKRIPARLLAYNSNFTAIEFAQNSQCEEIGDRAFDYSKFTSIVFPDSLKKIGKGIFYEDNTLENVTLGENVEVIDSEAFFYCRKLKSINLPKSLKTIGDKAFYQCSSLDEVTIHAGDVKIGSEVFYYCYSVTKIYIDNLSDWLKFAANGHSYSYLTSGTTYVKGEILTEVEIPDDVTTIKPYAFAGWDITSVTMSNNVTTIGSNAFSNCTSLTDITLSNTLKTIGEYAFRNCSGLTSLEIPNSVTSIGTHAFRECTNLTSINLPENLTNLEGCAFNECINLSQLRIDAIELGDLIKIYEYSNTLFLNVGSNNDGVSVVIGSKVKRIPAYLFKKTSSYSSSSNINIKEIIFEEGSQCTYISHDVFDNGVQIDSIYVSNIEVWLNIGFGNSYSNPVSSSTNFYVDNELITELVIPNTTTKINDYAFKGFGNLTSITIPESITSIGNYAFYNTTGLTQINYNAINASDLPLNNYTFYNAGTGSDGITVNIGKNVTRVPANLFNHIDSAEYYIPNIINVVFEEDSNCTNVGVNAFKYVTFDIDYPENITLEDGSTGGSPDTGTGSDTTTLNNGCVEYVVCGDNQYKVTAVLDKNLTEIVWPENVVEIADSVFVDCVNLTSVTIPNGVTVIENNVFQNCTNLTQVIIHDGVTSIGSYAFENCINLSNVELPNSIIYINSYAFNKCYSFTNITIPRNVTYLGTESFANCYNVTTINYNATCIQDANYGSGIYHLAGRDTDGVSFIVGANVTMIPDDFISAYTPSVSGGFTVVAPKITTFTFEEGSVCESMGKYTFYFAVYLTEITLPSSIRFMEEYVFNGTENLRKVNISNLESWCNIEFENFASNPFSSASEIYLNGEKLTMLEIPSSVTTIKPYAFYNASINRVIIPESVQTIETDAFGACTKLYEVINNSNLEFTLGSTNNGGVARYAKSIINNINDSKIYIDGDFVYYEDGTGEVELIQCLDELIIPEGVTKLGYELFYGNLDLTSITIPSSVKVIGEYAFRNTGLTSIFIPNTVEVIGLYAFAGCEKLESIIFEENSTCKEIGGSAFASNYNLTNVVLPNTNVKLAGNIFSNCSSLRSITIPDNMIFLSSYMFAECSSLKEVTLSNGMSEISNYAFYNCKALFSITLPKKLINIGSSAFWGCENLMQVINLSKLNVQKGKATFGYVAVYAKAVVNSIEDSKIITDENGYVFYNDTSSKFLINYVGSERELVLPSDFNYYIYASAFSGNNSIVSVKMFDNITSIGQRAFYGCSNLQSVEIGANVKSIGTYAFYNCKELNEIKFNATAMNNMSSNNYTFYNAGIDGDGIVVTIGSNVTSIPAYLFTPYNNNASSHPKISKVIFADNGNCTSIGSSAFNSCITMEGIYVSDIDTWLKINFNNGATNPLSLSNGLYVNNLLISNLTIPSSVVSIGNYSFYGYNRLLSITGGENLISIGQYAFSNCTGLTNIELPKNLTTIGNYAFDGCVNVTSINYKSLALNNLSSSNYVFNNVGMNSTGVTVVIDKDVTSIPSYLFYPQNSNSEYAKLISIEFEEGSLCHTINSYAFAGCRDLKTISLPESLTTLGTYAFAYTTYLNKIYFNATALNDLTASNYAFYRNNYVNGAKVDVVIGANVTRLPAYIFYSINSILTSVEFEEGSQCKTIATRAFNMCTKLKNIVIPDSVTSIGQYTFYYCTALTSVTIGQGVSTIDKYAFNECTALEEIKLNAISLSDFVSDNYIFSKAGTKGEGIVLTVGANATRIPSYIFYPYSKNYTYTPKVKALEFEDDSKCTYIGASAFNGTAVERIAIGEGVTTLGGSAFNSCYNLKEIDFRAISMNNLTNNSYHIFNYAGRDSGGIKMTIGSKVTHIPAYLFYNNYYNNYPQISEIVFDKDSVCASIGNYAFYKCNKLSIITIPESMTSIGASAFQDCSNLLEVVNLSELPITIGSTSNGYVAYYAVMIYTTETESKVEIYNDVYTFYNGGATNTYLIKYSGVDSELVLPENYKGNPYGIHQKAFYDNQTLTMITMPETLTKISEYAFYNCRNLTSIEIPKGVTSIGQYAFYGCQNVEEIKFNATSMNDLTSGNHVFAEVASNVEGGIVATIGANVTRIPAYLFNPYANGPYYGANINSIVFEDNSQCTSIGTYAFAYMESLKSLEIPELITTIGNKAVYRSSYITELKFNATSMNNLTSSVEAFTSIGIDDFGITVTIGANVTKVPAYLFYSNSNIHTVIFEEESVCSSIGSYAFSYSDNLSAITLPQSITTIGASAFYACSSLGSLVIPEGITIIDSQTFYGCQSLSKIVMPESLRTISNKAFYNCKALTSVVIPQNVSSIGTDAFRNCTALMDVVNLSSLNIVAGATTYGYVAYYALNVGTTSKIEIYNGIKFFDAGEGNIYVLGSDGTHENLVLPTDYNGSSYTIYNKAFYNDLTIKSIEISEGVTSIGEYAFYGCTELTSVIIKEGITTIGNHTFDSCTSLVSVQIPNSVTSIGEYAFYNCSSLISLVLPEGVTSIGDYSLAYCTSLTSINFPNSITYIGEYSFYKCLSLNSITIPENITVLNKYAFYECLGVTEINYNAIEVENLDMENYVFYKVGQNGDGINVVIGEKVTRLPTYLFNPYIYEDYTPKIISVVFADNCVCTIIGQGAFSYCVSLENVEMSNNITSIEYEAFYACGNLSIVKMSKSLTTINSYAFAWCTSLLGIEIPESVTMIGSNAFYACYLLNNIYYNATNLTAFSSYNYVFYNAGKDGDGITVTIGKKVTSIPAYLFCPYSSTSYAPKIISVLFEEGSNYTSIGNYAFAYCSSLVSIQIPESVTTIGNYAFNSCSNITDVYYGGTSEQFVNISIGSSNTTFSRAKVTYYFGWAIVSEVVPTCMATGLIIYQKGEGENLKTSEVVIPKIAHTFENGVCTICGLEVSLVVNETSSGSYGFINSNGTYTSNNKGVNSSNAYATITARKACTIVITWTVSSESSYDKLYIYLNDTVQSTVNGVSGSKNGTLTLTLAAGDVVKFRYSKDSSSASGSDCATFSYTETEIV